MARKKYMYRVFNETDGIYATPVALPTKRAAEVVIQQLRARFRAQGYYLTSGGKRIAPDQIKYVIDGHQDY